MRYGGRGRIRVNRDEAIMLAEILNEKRHRLVILRADARDRGEPLTQRNFDIAVVNRMLEETDRTIEEMGWLATESS